MTDLKLPELPEAAGNFYGVRGDAYQHDYTYDEPVYTAAQLTAYATAAVIAERAACDERETRWQTMASVPKDGRVVLCWVSAVRIGEDDDGNRRDVDVSEADFGRWTNTEHGGYFDNMMDRIGDEQAVTHWQPIPSAPTAEQITASIAEQYADAMAGDDDDAR